MLAVLNKRQGEMQGIQQYAMLAPQFVDRHRLLIEAGSRLLDKLRRLGDAAFLAPHFISQGVEHGRIGFRLNRRRLTSADFYSICHGQLSFG